MKLTIYSKPDCPLCDDAKEVVHEVSQRLPFALEVEEVDIQTDPALFERFRYDIPVLFIDGRKVFKHRVDATDLEKKLLRHRGTNIA